MSPSSHGGVGRPTIQTATRGSQLIRAARPELVEDDAGDLRGISVQLDATVAPLLAGATVPGWVGQSGDNYDAARDNLRKVVQGCADALEAAADAMETYAGVVRWAHGQAQDALDDYRRDLTYANELTKLRDAESRVAGANLKVKDADTELRVALQALSSFLPRPETPLAEAMRSAGDWWDGLDVWQQILVTAAFAAIVAASGGTVGVAFGTAGVATFGLEHAHGAATFTEDPGAATRNYLETTTPAQAAWHAGETALTFGPGAFGGALVGTGVRHAAADAAANPGVFADRIRNMDWASDAGAITPEAFWRREPIEMTNGQTLPAPDAQGLGGELDRYNALPQSTQHAHGAEGAYQERLYGRNEREVTLESQTPKSDPANPTYQRVIWDGVSPVYGVPADAKFIGSERSFYVPGSIGHERLDFFLLEKTDLRLRELEAAAHIMGGRGAFEITTNNPAYADFIESRMRALGIAGYVRLEP